MKIEANTSIKHSDRLGRLAGLHRDMYIKAPEVIGREFLLSISANRPIVIATTHLTDIDVETAVADAARYRRVGIAAEATNLQSNRLGPISKFATEGNLFGISGKLNQKTKKAEYKIRPEEFLEMKKAFANGISIVCAAHSPTYDWQFPDSAGFGAVLLAQQLDKPVILPVAVDIDNQNGNVKAAIVNDLIGMTRRALTRKRPKSTLTYGEPLYFSKIPKEDMDLVGRLLNSNQRRKMSNVEKLQARFALDVLEVQRVILAESISKLLPLGKRGKWGLG